ncbi:hypothetical protein HDU76_013429 [Blyttiomyces sp. JEL0837]|nr:hypothetical protein HDU76_013429 [Blyttiomyces sp. JEL0837]
MGSPDPDGRQIDWLGGGVSYLSKVAVIGPSSSAASSTIFKSNTIGGFDMTPKDDLSHKDVDVLYLFGQVEVRKPSVDWSTTCGNLVPAVAHAALSDREMFPEGKLLERIESFLEGKGKGKDGDSHWKNYGFRSDLNNNPTNPPNTLFYPVRIKALNTNCRITAHVPLRYDLTRKQVTLLEEGSAKISGVPGHAPPIWIEFLKPHGLLGKPLNHVKIHGESIDVDVILRAVSVGNFHRTLQATVLMAASAGALIEGSVLSDAVSKSNSDRKRVKDTNEGDGVVLKEGVLKVGHPAGIASAGARVQVKRGGGSSGELGDEYSVESVTMLRTARCIMEGSVVVPDEGSLPK